MMNCIEEEVVFLKAIVEIIDSIINFEIISISVFDDNLDSYVRANSDASQKLFNIILVDFLSNSDSLIVNKQQSYLGALRCITDNPNFNFDFSVNKLRMVTLEFQEWLNKEVEVDIWLPSINIDTTLRIKRLLFLKICGNISKHNFLRSHNIAKNLMSCFIDNGINVSIEECLLALSDFYEKFHVDVLSYHISTISEFFNNLRWGIHEYMVAEFNRSYNVKNIVTGEYGYRYPDAIKNKFAQGCYWDLMNDIRGRPIMKKFIVSKYFKIRY